MRNQNGFRISARRDGPDPYGPDARRAGQKEVRAMVINPVKPKVAMAKVGEATKTLMPAWRA